MATSKVPVLKKSSSAQKRTLQGEKRHARNVSVLSRLKTEEKKLRAALETGTEEVKALFNNFISALDKAAKQGVIHKNAASRKKSRLTTRVVAGPKPAAVVKPKKAKAAAPKKKATSKKK